MKIRSHLLFLVGGALLPLLLFAFALTGYSWWQQRHTVEQRQLERVRAVTISIETELQSTVRAARSLALSPDLEGRLPDSLEERIRQMLSAQPMWSFVGIGDAEGRTLQVVPRAGAPVPTLAIDPDMARRVVRTREPAISGLVTLPSGRFQTQVAVPVSRDGEVPLLLVVAVEPSSWLAFMGQFPVGSGGTLTLLDQSNRIIARTLNNAEVVGKRPTSEYLKETTERVEGAYRAHGMEGQLFLAAHSRSVRWGWTVATGLPVDAVNTALRESSLALAVGALVSIALAVLLAFLFGRRIEAPIAGLGDSARRLAHGDPPEPVPALEGAQIDEVDRVSEAFADAARRLRERQEALNAALSREQAARLEAESASRGKDEFLAMLGHELRNPLNAITSAVAVLGPGDVDRAQRARDIIGRQVHTLRELVDDLLDVARVTSGKIVLAQKPIDLGRLVRHAVAAMEASGRLGRHEVAVSAAETWVLGDETRLEQVATNLVDNAVKYTPEGGRIAVRVFEREGEAALVVEDNGSGIAGELMPKVFDLFTQGERTLDRAQGGLGLGLTLVRRLVELHAGRVWAESAGPGRGASFTVVLPKAQRPEAVAAPAVAAAAGESLRILVVEDNADGRETLMTVLEMQGHEVRGADSGPSGLEELEQFQPDLAIVDIGLPGYDGFELARRVRAIAGLARTRLVALTGYGQEEDRAQARSAGFDWFLVKPADLGAISAIIAQV